MGVTNYPWPSTVNVANFVTVKLCLGGDDDDERSLNFKIWKTQMLCLLQSQDVEGFVNGLIKEPPQENADEHKLWSRTDKLVKGWILGSIDVYALRNVWEKPTARAVWVELGMLFIEEEQQQENTKYLQVYRAAQRGDWDTAREIFQGDTHKLSMTVIGSASETALHVAVLTGRANAFVENLVAVMPPGALGLQDASGRTALHNAAIVGNTTAARALVEKNRNLLYIEDNTKTRPVEAAAISCQKRTLEYLITQHEVDAQRTFFEGNQGIDLLIAIISSEYVDIALRLVRAHPKLALLKDADGNSALSTIAMTDTLFPKRETLSWRQKFTYHCIRLMMSKREAAAHTTSLPPDLESLTNNASSCNYSALYQIISPASQKLEPMISCVIDYLVPEWKKLVKKKSAIKLARCLCDQLVSEPENDASVILNKSIMNAAEYGIGEIVEIIIEKFPMVAFYRDRDSGRTVPLIAARRRYDDIINLIYNMSDRRKCLFKSTDVHDNNILHMCGKLAPSHRLNLVAGPALQMQRELQWFEEIKEKIVHPSRRTWANNKGKTPQEYFTKEHEKLKEEGEKWMKDTAKACSVAAALIVTVMFAAAFTVPGGDPNHIFVVSDSISLFTSTTSLLMFLSILTARYAEEDFLYVLPKRLSIGLITLFMSITFMMIAFSVTLRITLKDDQNMAWFLILIAVIACLPVTSFVLLQFPLLVDVLYSTYGYRIFRDTNKTHSFLY